ncbi:MAG: sortase domain-bontaining protein, partial [Brooklawnia sp.]
SFPGQSQTEWPIMAGISSRDMATGVGWYPQTAGAGEIGNMVLAGHRLTHGAPFADLLELDVGDQVRITTCTHVFTYLIEVAPRDLTVQAPDDWVLDAVPGEPGRQPTGRMITLVTSQDLLPTRDRSVGMGILASAEPR